MSELVWGIKNGDLELVRKIVEEKGVNLNEVIDGRPPLLYASDYGQGDVVEYLIHKGANVNAADKHGITALLAAIWESHVHCVKILLKHGASKKGSTPDGTSYFQAAENEEIRNLLR